MELNGIYDYETIINMELCLISIRREYSPNELVSFCLFSFNAAYSLTIPSSLLIIVFSVFSQVEFNIDWIVQLIPFISHFDLIMN